ANVSEVLLKEFLLEMEICGKDLASKKQIDFVLSYEHPLPKCIKFDALKIRRALINLISNAVKYSPSKSKIQIVVDYNQAQLHFKVTDQGQGIPEDEFSKLFKEFGKTSVRPTDGESSSGMGLAIVKKIVKQHGGEVAVRSEIGK